MPTGIYKRTEENSRRGLTLIEEYGVGRAKEIRRKLVESHLGQEAWNKGLTAEVNDSVKRIKESKVGKPRPDMVGNQFSIGLSINKKLAALKRKDFPFITTSIEKRLYVILKKLDIKFKKEKVLISKFKVDVYIKKYSLVIEADGEYWHSREGDEERDRKRDELLKENGYIVLRFWGETLLERPKSCRRLIKKIILKLDKGKVRTARRLAESGRNTLTSYHLKKIIKNNDKILEMMSSNKIEDLY